MATKNIVPRTGSEGEVGTSAKPWSKAHIDELTSSIGVSASYFYGDGTGLTNLSTTTPTIEDVLTAGNVATTPFTGSGIRVDDIGNTTLSITANSGDLNLSSSANVNLDLAGGDFKVEGGRMTVGTSGVNVEILQKGNLSVIGTATLPIVSSSVGVSGAFFQGDGSGLTNLPAASWDGQLNGDAGITGSLEIKSDTGLVMVGDNGTASGSLFHSGGGLLLGGEFGVPAGIMAPNSQAFMSNGAASVEATGTDVNLTPNAAGKVAVAGALSASLGITAGSVTTDNVVSSGGFTIGSAVITEGEFERLDGASSTVVANKVVIADGSKNVATLGTVGCGAITSTGVSSLESVDVSGSTSLGNLSTDTHQFTGSVNISGALYAGTENPEEDHQIIGTLLVDAAGTNNSELIVDGPNPNFIKLNRNSSTTGMFSTDGSRLTLYGGTAGFAAQIYDGSGDDRGIIDLARSNGLITGTKHKLNISASTNALRVDTNSGNSVFAVKDDTTGLIHLSASGQIYGNGYDNGQKTANFTIDWNNGSNQIVSVSGAAATGLTASFSNIKPWSTYQFIYQVDKTNMELYLDHSIFWPGGTRPSLSNVSGSRDIVTFTTDGDSNMYAVAQFNFSASVG